MKEALAIWREKLRFLQHEEAIVVDPASKFALAKQIEEAQTKITELEATNRVVETSGATKFFADISRIIKYAPAELIGREAETKVLADAWDNAVQGNKNRPRIITFVALGGEGKTSLVAKWAAELAAQDWPGCDAAFAWSFYSQGTRDQVAASSDLFLKEALIFFGDDKDKEFAASSAGAFEKGQRLARIVGQRRSLLILDGLEPLQYAPNSPMPGQLKDQGIAALLKGLAAVSHGLCVVTTRYSLPDLKAFWQTTAPEVKLLRLSRAAGVHLLQSIGVKGSLLRNIPFHQEQVNEFEKLVEDVQGHALTLNLLGTYLRDAHVGDIRKRDLVKLEEADAEEQGGHAFRVMEAYEREFEREGDKGRRAFAVLRLLGLFDRPLTSDCLGALLQTPAISGLTEPLVDLTEAQRNLVFKRLEDARLLTVNRDITGSLESLDAHALIREYFLKYLLTAENDVWKNGNLRLATFLSIQASITRSDSSREARWFQCEMLYRAAIHYCKAGLFEVAFEKVYLGQLVYTPSGAATREFGCFGIELSLLREFFKAPWSQLIDGITSQKHVTELLRGTGFALIALGRYKEGMPVLKAALDCAISLKDSLQISINARNIANCLIKLGSLSEAQDVLEVNLEHAGELKDGGFMALGFRCSLGYAKLMLEGVSQEVAAIFEETRKFRDRVSGPIALPAYHYHQFLITHGQASEALDDVNFLEARSNGGGDSFERATRAIVRASCFHFEKSSRKAHTAIENAGQLAKMAGRAELSLECCILQAEILIKELRLPPLSLPDVRSLGICVRDAEEFFLYEKLDLLRVRFLVCRAWLRFLTGVRTGPESAQEDLDEAWEIAERGPMKLFMADIHLHRARLFFREKEYPKEWISPQADLAAAEKLINDCGYLRRDEELADAKRAILGIA